MKIKDDLEDYLIYRKLEKEFNQDTNRQSHMGDPELYINGIREAKRNSLKSTIKTSLVALAAVVALAGTGAYIHNSEAEYQEILKEAIKKADLDGDGQISNSREMARFFNNLPCYSFLRI